MKFKSKLIAGLAVISLLFSCQKDQDNMTSSANNHQTNVLSDQSTQNAARGEKRITSKDMEFVGIKHNEALENVYNSINQNNLPCIPINNVIEEYIPQDSDLYAPVKEIVFKAGMQAAENGRNTLDVPEIKNHLTEGELTYLTDLKTIVYNATPYDSEGLIRNIDDLERVINADANLSNKELTTIYGSTNVAKYSSKYWTRKNLNKWFNNNSEEKKSRKLAARGGDDDWVDVVYADCVGGAAAGAGAWIMNVVPGWGQVSYAGAIAGGALAGSVQAVLSDSSCGYSVSIDDCL